MVKIIIASNNKNKVKEIKHILGAKRMRVLSLAEAGFRKDIKETGETLAENAAIKAREVSRKFRSSIIIADDSGLEVDYLAKAPGVYSARFAGPQCSYTDNNKKLLKLMKGASRKERNAAFRTVACVIFPGGKEEFVEGKVNGIIIQKEKGPNGFGYDPVFYLKKFRKTYAQMTLKEKNSVSHRAKAFKNAGKIIKKRLRLKSL